MGFPSQRLQGLEDATPRQLAEVEVTPSGYGLHWESLDIDLGVPELVAGLFGSKAWMSELGRKKAKVSTYFFDVSTRSTCPHLTFLLINPKTI